MKKYMENMKKYEGNMYEISLPYRLALGLAKIPSSTLFMGRVTFSELSLIFGPWDLEEFRAFPLYGLWPAILPLGLGKIPSLFPLF